MSSASETARNSPECRHARLKDSGEAQRAFCTDCGYVLHSIEDHSMTFKDEFRNKATPRISHSSSEERIAPQEGGPYMSEFSIISKQACKEWQRSAKASDQSDKNFAEALSEITRIAIELSLPKLVLQKAAKLRKLLLQKRLSHGRSMRASSAAVVYIACRQSDVGIALHEIAEISGADTRTVGRYCSILGRELNQVVPLPRLRDYAPRILHKLRADEKLSENVKRMLTIVEEQKLVSGRDPRGLVSASIYLASRFLGQRRTQREISNIADVTEMTIRKNCRLLERRACLLDTCWA